LRELGELLIPDEVAEKLKKYLSPPLIESSDIKNRFYIEKENTVAGTIPSSIKRCQLRQAAGIDP